MADVTKIQMVEGVVYEHTDDPGPRNERSVHFVEVRIEPEHATVSFSDNRRVDVPWELIDAVLEVRNGR